MHEESVVHKFPAAWKTDLALSQECPIYDRWKIHVCAKKNKHAGKHTCIGCKFEWTEIYQNTRKEEPGETSQSNAPALSETPDSQGKANAF